MVEVCRFVLSQNFYHDYSAARYYNTGSMGDLSLTIARDTRVIADVFVADSADPQLGAIIKDTNSRGRIHRVGILVPQNLWCWCAICLAVQYDRVTWNQSEQSIRNQ